MEETKTCCCAPTISGGGASCLSPTSVMRATIVSCRGKKTRRLPYHAAATWGRRDGRRKRSESSPLRQGIVSSRTPRRDLCLGPAHVPTPFLMELCLRHSRTHWWQLPRSSQQIQLPALPSKPSRARSSAAPIGHTAGRRDGQHHITHPHPRGGRGKSPGSFTPESGFPHLQCSRPVSPTAIIRRTARRHHRTPKG